MLGADAAADVMQVEVVSVDVAAGSAIIHHQDIWYESTTLLVLGLGCHDAVCDDASGGGGDCHDASSRKLVGRDVWDDGDVGNGGGHRGDDDG
eukprot:2711328-Rhodomonas_salina.2